MLRINFSEKALTAIPKPGPGGKAIEVSNIKNPWQRAWINQTYVSLGYRIAANNERFCEATHRLPGDSLRDFDRESTQRWLEIKSGKFRRRSNITLGAFFDQFYVPYSRLHHRDHKGALSRFQRIKAELGHMKVAEIEKSDIQLFLNGLIDEKQHCK